MMLLPNRYKSIVILLMFEIKQIGPPWYGKKSIRDFYHKPGFCSCSVSEAGTATVAIYFKNTVSQGKAASSNG